MDNINEHFGGCLCGQSRYKTIGQPERAAVCHCRYCQLRSGSAFGTLVYFKEENVKEISGVFKIYSFVSESGKTWENKFCSNCGTTLIFRLEVWEGDVGISGGTFDPPSFWYDLNREVFTRSKSHFVDIHAPEQVETFRFYNPVNLEDQRLQGNRT